MTSYEFEVAAKNALIKFIQDKYDETFNIHEIHLVSFTHVLGSKKGTLIDSGANERYYEVTYDKDKDALYIDAYQKEWNIRIPGGELDFTVHE